jgi:hypothetical protein
MKPMARARSLIWLLLLGACPNLLAQAQVVTPVTTSDELARALRDAKAGSIITLSPGIYRGGISAQGLKGTDAKPIVVRSADSDKPATIQGGASGIHLAEVAYLVLENLVFENATANGLNIDDGGVNGASHHVTLRNLQIRNVGSNGNHDGIKLSGLDDFRVTACEVERWGTGGSGIDMVGCHRGLIESSSFRHWGDELAANGVQTKGGSSQIEVRGCRFEHAGSRAINLGGSTDEAYFRPIDAKSEASDITVTGCTIIGSMAAVAFVGVDGAVVRGNTIYRPKRWVMRILQENQSPRFTLSARGRFVENVIVFRSDELATAVNIGPHTDAKTFMFEGNQWFCTDRPDRSRLNLPVEETRGRYGEDPKFQDPENGNFRRGGA